MSNVFLKMKKERRERGQVSTINIFYSSGGVRASLSLLNFSPLGNEKKN